MSETEDWKGGERRGSGQVFCTEHQAIRLSQEAARATVQEMFQAMGINVSDAEHVIQAQVDFAYLRRSRRSAENAASHAKKILVGLGISGVVGAVWAAIKVKGGT